LAQIEKGQSSPDTPEPLWQHVGDGRGKPFVVWVVGEDKGLLAQGPAISIYGEVLPACTQHENVQGLCLLSRCHLSDEVSEIQFMRVIEALPRMVIA
jgi:hypothetical protein